MPKRKVIARAQISAAEKVVGLRFTEAERKLMLDGVNERLSLYQQLRAISIDNAIPPAFAFDPRLPGMAFETRRRQSRFSRVHLPHIPSDLEELAFWR